MTYIQSYQEKKTYSHMQHHVSTQCQKTCGLSLRYDNTTDGQSHRKSSIAGEIIINEGRTRKVSRETHFKIEEKERMDGASFKIFGKDFRSEPFARRLVRLGTLGGKARNKEKKETRYHPLLTTKKLSQGKILSQSQIEEQFAPRPVHLLLNTQLCPQHRKSFLYLYLKSMIS